MDEHTLNDLLECSVCLERLDTSSKVLPCQHTFCRKCLEVIVSSHNMLRCPECRIIVNVKIDDLPPNVLLMRILEGMKQQQQLKSDARKEQSAENSVHTLQPPAGQQQRRVPHAYALFDFESGEGSDLRFKKGDLIVLRRKIDRNWYVGSLNGVEGTFPMNYVQVVEPLPGPMCKALYDFKMGPNEEEGCLAFKKGTAIHVLRRVDPNWAEGRIGTNIGIFPIAFVELNLPAKHLLESPETAQPPETTAEPTPTPLTNRDLPPVPNTTNQQPQPAKAQLPATTTYANTLNTPATTHSAGIANSNLTLSSPTNSERLPPNSPCGGSSSVRYRDNREKRHSLNTLLSASGNVIGTSCNLGAMKSNRHSAEILSVPSELSSSGCNAASPNARMIAALPAAEATPTSSAHNQTQRVNVLKTCNPQNMPISLPWGYFALYPYKPRKSDELELKKGCVYIVTERCLDGWFKGKNWQNISGVFPGNYVAPLRERDQQQLMHQLKYVPSHGQSAAPSTTPAIAPPVAQHPPDLPPRHTLGNFAAYKSVWIKPLNQTVEAFFNRQSSSSTLPNNAPDKDPKPNTANTTTCSSSAVSIMKRLTSIKGRSKSPNVTNHQPLQSAAGPSLCGVNATNSLMDNLTVQDDTTPQPNKLAHVHVRSGSCPSQLLQNQPTDANGLQLSDQQVSPQSTYGSKRVKANKERQSLQLPQSGARQTVETQIRSCAQNIGLPAPPPPASLPNANHQNPMLFTKCGQQQTHHEPQPVPQQHQPHQQQPQIYHRKSQSLDASALMGPTMQTIAMTTTSPPHITAAAIAASATTKSTQSTRESRFRCVVPYPPNSDIELELHVGDIIYVQRKQKNGWYKGTHARTNKTGLFPASFVEPDV